MTDSPKMIELPGQPSTEDVVGLLEQLCANVSKPVELNAERVKILTSLELQILIAAKSQWMADGAAFSITDPSDGFLSGLANLGFSLEHLDEKAVQ